MRFSALTPRSRPPQIAHYKVPRYIEFRDDFPKTVTGKIQKFVMRNTMARELGLAE